MTLVCNEQPTPIEIIKLDGKLALLSYARIIGAA